MTTKTTMEKDTTSSAPHWAEALGRRVAERRAERLAERQAEEEAETGRSQLPAAELRRLFAETVNLTLESIDKFATAAEIPIDPAPPSPTSVELRAAGGEELLRLQLDDDTIIVTRRSRSHGDQHSISLTEDFSPETAARQIAEQWIRQIAVATEGPNGTR